MLALANRRTCADAQRTLFTTPTPISASSGTMSSHAATSLEQQLSPNKPSRGSQVSRVSNQIWYFLMVYILFFKWLVRSCLFCNLCNGSGSVFDCSALPTASTLTRLLSARQPTLVAAEARQNISSVPERWHSSRKRWAVSPAKKQSFARVCPSNLLLPQLHRLQDQPFLVSAVDTFPTVHTSMMTVPTYSRGLQLRGWERRTPRERQRALQQLVLHLLKRHRRAGEVRRRRGLWSRKGRYLQLVRERVHLHFTCLPPTTVPVFVQEEPVILECVIQPFVVWLVIKILRFSWNKPSGASWWAQVLIFKHFS